LQKSNICKRPITAMTDPRTTPLRIDPLAPAPQHGRWRTEAMRSHATARLLFFTRGQGRITVAGLTSGYGPNNLVFVPAHTMYGYEAGPTVQGHMIAIPEAMAGDWPEEHVHLRLRDVHAQKDIAARVEQLERELTSDRTGHSRAAHHYLGILAIAFERHVETRAPEAGDDRADTAPARLVAAYTDLVERDFRSGKGVAGFARDLGVTATHLTRCCNRTCGRSALAILNDRILYEARTLLRDTSAPIKDIASGLGFGSAAYFARSFHARTGATPTDFRRLGPLRPH